MFEVELRDIAYVPRWGILRRIRTQSVAEHSYYVTLYASQIAELIEWSGDMGDLLQCAMIHDLFEARSGDIPAPAKRKIVDKDKEDALEEDFFEQFQELLPFMHILKRDEEIRAIVKVADMLEGCMYLAQEFMLGNSYVGLVDEDGSPSQDMYRSLRNAWYSMVDAMWWIDEKRGDILFREQIATGVMDAYGKRPRILMANPG